MRTVILCTCLLLQGCAGGALKEILFPTPVACAPKNSPTPPKVVSDSLLSKMDDFHLTLIIAAERLELIDYSGKAAAIIEACR